MVPMCPIVARAADISQELLCVKQVSQAALVNIQYGFESQEVIRGKLPKMAKTADVCKAAAAKLIWKYLAHFIYHTFLHVH